MRAEQTGTWSAARCADGEYYNLHYVYTQGAGNGAGRLHMYVLPNANDASDRPGGSTVLEDFTAAYPGMSNGQTFHFREQIKVDAGKWRYWRIMAWTYNADDGGASSSWVTQYEGSIYGNTGSDAVPFGYSGGEVAKQICWSLPANIGVNPVNYQVWRNSDNVPVAEAYMSAGAPARYLCATGLPDGASYGQYTLKLWFPGLMPSGDSGGLGGSWVTVNPPTNATDGTVDKPGGDKETVFTPTSTGSGANVVVSGTTPGPGNAVTVTAVPVGPATAVPAPGGGGTIWVNPPSGGGLTDTAYREGVDRLRDGLGKTKEVTEGIMAAKGRAEGEGSSDNQAAGGAAAKTQAQNVIGSAPSGLGYTVSGGTAPSMTFQLSQRMGGQTFDFNPFQSGRFADVAAWFRLAMQWLCLALLAVWVWREMGQWIRATTTVPQAKGNPVVAGTGAQATALVAAGLMTAAIIIALTALLAFGFGGITFSSLAGAITTNPLSGLAAGSVWLLDQLFPLATMLACFVARIAFQIYASAIFAGCAAVVRFVVP